MNNNVILRVDPQGMNDKHEDQITFEILQYIAFIPLPYTLNSSLFPA